MRLIDVLGALARRWPIIAVCCLICAVVAGGYSKLSTKVYRASTLVSVTASKFDYGNGLAAQQLLGNYALEIKSDDLLSTLDQQMKLDKSPADLKQAIQATPDNTNSTITIDVDDTEAQRAADIANQLSQLFVATIQAENQAHLNPAIDVRVYQQASVPSSPNRPKTKTNTLAGALLGLLIGAGAAYLIDVWDDRLRSEYDVETGLGLPLLANMPRMPMSSGRLPLPPSSGNGATPSLPSRERDQVGRRKE